MATWITLLRGINVGGRNILPMQELRDLLNELGYSNVQTYIQSGNCVFDTVESNSIEISVGIASAIEKTYGYKLSVLTFSAGQLTKAIKQNPFDAKSNEPKCVHFFFLSEESVVADMEALQRLKLESESFVLTKNVFYLFAPDGIGRSKLAAGAEAKLGVATTARNFRTVTKLADIAASS